MTIDEQYMLRCIQLARLGAGMVAPNPMVGSVLVYAGKIIGEGYHRLYGQPHAEVNCIRDAEARFSAAARPGTTFGEVLEQSTIYVSLEPCAHYGKTPPCADLIIQKGIPRVVVGCRDPFPLVAGKGIEKLRAAGVSVTVGVLEEQCTGLNSRFFTFHTRKRPYIVLKWAQSSNGRIASAGPARTLISGEIVNRLVHRWRSEEYAILVGTETARLDDPTLTTRLWKGRNPVRMVLDRHLRLPQDLTMFRDGLPTLVYTCREKESRDGLLYYVMQEKGPLANRLVEAMHSLNIQSVLVEGGARLLQSFLDAQLWDEARVITNGELEIPGGLKAPVMRGGVVWQTDRYGADEVKIYRPAGKQEETA